MWLDVLKTKDEAFDRFKRIKARAEAETGLRLLGFRSDRGGEFNSTAFRQFCDDGGIKHFTTAPYTPQQNGVVERRNQTTVEMARCLLKSMGVPATFWGEAVKTAVYLLNRAPTRSVDGMTPYEAWHGRKPAVHHLRTFGCVAHVKRLGPGIDKLADRSTPMIFVGYEEGSKAYRVYDPATKKVRVTRDAKFEEQRRWDWTATTNTSAPPLDEPLVVVYSDEPVDAPTPSPSLSFEAGSSSNGAAPHRDVSTSSWGTSASSGKIIDTPQARGVDRNCVTPQTPSPASTEGGLATPPSDDHERHDLDDTPPHYRKIRHVLEELDEERSQHVGLSLMAAEEPASVIEALTEACWKEAMDAELAAIRDNGTWELTTLPRGHRAIGLKWVYKVKKDPAGRVVKYKARLVAKGYAQRQGVDYDEVFAPVARMETVHLLLALAAHRGWPVHHMDVKSAFLNGDLEEEVYVHQPPGFIDDKNTNGVL
jgi:hypothetical protein